jgi:spermidine synthase
VAHREEHVLPGESGAAAGPTRSTARQHTFSSGTAELLADLDRPGGWLLLIDRIRQSYVDLDDPTYLDFEYVQAFADVIDALPAGPLAVTHVGGGAATLARYVAATRPGSPQIVLEPDAALTALVRARLPFARDARVRVRAVDGRTGVAALRDSSADVLVVDAFLGGRVPAELTTAEFVADAARVLRADGVLLVNIADGPPGIFTKRLVATVRTALPEVLVVADAAVLKLRRFGNVVLVASAQALPGDAIVAASARAMFPRSVRQGAQLRRWVGAALPLVDDDSMRSPAPPDDMWRVPD